MLPTLATRLTSPRTSRLSVAAAAAAVITLLATVPGAALAQSSDGAFQVYSRSAHLDMVELATRIIELPDATRTVDQFDPAVLSIEGVSDRQVRVTALSPGVTTIGFVSESGVVREVEVFVKGDTRHLQAYLRELFPGSNIKAVQVGETGDAVVLRGWVTDPSHIAEIMDIAGELYANPINQMRAATTERVLLECRVMEVNRSKLREFGFDFINFGSTVRLGSSPGALTPQGVFEGTGGLGLPDNIFASPTLALQIVRPGYQFLGFLQALQTESLAKILAEPKLTVTSGRPATLLSGGEFPILVPQGIGQSTIEFREFGVRVEAVAVVLGDNRLRLDISPEVSERDFSSAITLQGVQVPGLTTRRINTSAELGFGETLMLGGLVSNRDVAGTSKVPFLGELPYIGMAFSRKRYEQSETELLIMVTPYPAGTLDPRSLPPGPGQNTTFPDDRELYVNGLIELPNYGDACGDLNPNCGPGYLMPQAGCPTGACGTGACGIEAYGPMPAQPMPAGSLPPQTMPSYDAYPAETPGSYATPSYPNGTDSLPYAETYNPGIESIPALQPTDAGTMPQMQMEFDAPGTAEPIPAQPQAEQPVTSVRRPRLFRRGTPGAIASPTIVQTSATTANPGTAGVTRVGPTITPAGSQPSAPSQTSRRRPLGFLRSQY